MSQDVRKEISDQIQSRFQRLLPYKEHVLVLIDQYTPLANKFNRLSVQEVLKNIRLRYLHVDWSELKYLFQSIFVFILRAVGPTSQMSTTEELINKYPELAKEKTSTLVFLLEFWNLLSITIRIFDPNENAKDMMFFLERMCSPFQSNWNASIHQRVRIFEAETNISLSLQCANEVPELRRPVVPHNNSTFNPAELLLQTQRQHQLVQEMHSREQQLLRFQKLYPSQDQQQLPQRPSSYGPSQIPNDNTHQVQHIHLTRSPFISANPQLISTVLQQRQQLEQQLFQRRQQSLQQLYFPQQQPIQKINRASTNGSYDSSSSSTSNNQGNTCGFSGQIDRTSSNYHSSNVNSVINRVTQMVKNNISNTFNTDRANSIQVPNNTHSNYIHTSYSTHVTYHQHRTIRYTNNNGNNFTHNTIMNTINRKRTHSDSLVKPDLKEQRVNIQQPTRAEFWQQRLTSMCNNCDIPHRTSMLPATHSIFSFPNHDMSPTASDSLLNCTNTTTLREVVKDVLREHNAKKEKREKRFDLISETMVP